MDDTSRFGTVAEWYEAHRGRVPTQVPVALDRMMRETGCSLTAAYARLVRSGSIVELTDAPPSEPAEK